MIEASELRETIDWLASWSGTAAIVVGFGTVLAASLLTDWFSWTTHALSQLGRPGAEYAALFNGGLIVSGVFWAAFFCRLFFESDNALQYAGSVVLTGTAGSLVAVGAFPMGHAFHEPVSFALFVSLSLGLMIYGSGDLVAGDLHSGLLATWLSVVNAGAWLVWGIVYYLQYAGTTGKPAAAIPEVLGTLALAGFVIPATQRVRANSPSLDHDVIGDDGATDDPDPVAR